MWLAILTRTVTRTNFPPYLPVPPWLPIYQILPLPVPPTHWCLRLSCFALSRFPPSQFPVIWNSPSWQSQLFSCSGIPVPWDSSSVSNGSGLPGFGPGWTRNRGPGPGQVPPRNPTAQVLAGCYPDRTYTHGFLAVLEPDRGSNCTVPTTLATIKYLSSDHIMTWWIRRLSNFMSSFTSSNPICDPTDICRVSVK
jgi:hypothetical protein